MATATVKRTGVEVTLVLSEKEAQYVLEATRHAEPTQFDGEDPVFDALSRAGLEVDLGAVE